MGRDLVSGFGMAGLKQTVVGGVINRLERDLVGIFAGKVCGVLIGE